MFKNILPLLNLVLVVALASYVVYSHQAEKKAYILTQRVFDGFDGKKELERGLSELKADQEAVLDSLLSVVKREQGNQAITESYQHRLRTFELQYQELSQRYTADIWKRLNQYIQEYGAANDYDFIFGAAGNGGLMYADDSNDITDDLIKYINQRYAAD